MISPSPRTLFFYLIYRNSLTTHFHLLHLLHSLCAMARIIPARYTIAIVIFVIIVFVILTIAAIRVFGHPKPSLQRFPPWISECPPYWTNEGNNKCSYNPNQPNGKSSCTSSDLTNTSTVVKHMSYTDNQAVNFAPASLSDRCQWAKNCSVYWEGISDQSCSDQTHFQKYSTNN